MIQLNYRPFKYIQNQKKIIIRYNEIKSDRLKSEKNIFLLLTIAFFITGLCGIKRYVVLNVIVQRLALSISDQSNHKNDKTHFWGADLIFQ